MYSVALERDQSLCSVLKITVKYAPIACAGYLRLPLIVTISLIIDQCLGIQISYYLHK